MKTYKIDSFGNFEGLTIHDQEKLALGTHDVRVEVKATAFNYRDLAILTKNPKYPGDARKGVIPLSDASGVVTEIGSKVHRFTVGDNVTPNFFPRWLYGESNLGNFVDQYGSVVDGWLCSERVVNQEDLVITPKHLSFEESATIPCAALTAWNSLLAPDKTIRLGSIVLTQGTGGVSIFAIQLAKAMGATVISTTSGKEKEQKLREIGADHVINYKENPDWGEEVLKITNGHGADHVVEVGGSGTLNQSLISAAFAADIAQVGFLGDGAQSIDFDTLFKKGVNFRRIKVGSREDLERMISFMEVHKIKPVIDRVFSFSEAIKAYDYFSEQKFLGKVLIRH